MQVSGWFQVQWSAGAVFSRDLLNQSDAFQKTPSWEEDRVILTGCESGSSLVEELVRLLEQRREPAGEES